jgi:drug/metabolite transporter (DMT)-like permease
VLSPALALEWPPPPQALLLGLAASTFELLYTLALMAAYGVGDLSLVYPVARGSAPLLIAIWAVLWLEEQPSLAGWAGIALCVLGLALASLPSPLGQLLDREKRLGQALGLALLTGLCISGYSAFNKLGLRHLSPPAYTSLFHLGTALLLAPLLFRQGKDRLLAPLREDRARTLAIAVLLTGSSTLVLSALALESAAYVGAVREISVILGALAGWLWLAEPFGARRTVASAIMFAGMALIATRG